MKNLSFLFLLVFVVFSGCKKDIDDVEEKLFSFPITNEKQFTVPKADVETAFDIQTTYGVNMDLPVSGVASSTEADFQNNNTTTGLVKNIKLEELVLTIPDNSADDFTFLEKMDVYIAMDKNDPAPTLMAYNRDIKAVSSSAKLVRLVFDRTENSMDKYVKAGNYTLILRDTKLRRKITADMKITAKITYKVTASPLN